MPRSIGDVAVRIRARLDAALGDLGEQSQADRRNTLAAALEVPALTPDAILLRVAGADDPGQQLSGESGQAWPLLLAALAEAVRQTMSPWTLAIEGALSVGPDSVEPTAVHLPAGATIRLALGESRLADGPLGVVVKQLELVLNLADLPDACALSLAATGLRLDLPGGGVLDLLASSGLAFEGDFGARVDAGGVHFEGGGHNGVDVRLRRFPEGLKAPTLRLGARSEGGGPTGLALTAAFGATVLGMATASVEGIGVAFTGRPGGDAIDLVSPRGFGFAVNLGPVRGGGYLEERDGRYGGAMALTMGVLDVKAFGFLRTKPIFSFLAVLSAEFNPPIELGLAFTLNGLGGVLGINYAIDHQGLSRAVQEGHLDDLLFPSDPVGAAPRILATLSSVFVERQGSVVIGPMLRLAWGRPVSFLTADLGVILELPSGKVALLGRLRMALPAPQAAIIDLRAAVAGVIDVANGLVQLEASLTGSRLLFASIDGGLALRVKSGTDATFILSAGGFHPRYQAPAGFPTPKRLSIPIADSAFMQIVFSGYFAITPGTVQAGARLDVSIGTDALGVSGRLGFDAMIRWEPSFGFSLELYGSFDFHVFGESLCSIDLRLLVEGPTPCWHVAGHASIKLFLLPRISLPFDEHWGCTDDGAPPRLPEVARLLEQAVREPQSWSPVLPGAGGSLVSLRTADVVEGTLRLHPLGTIRFSQRVVPLGVAITRYGPVRLPAPTRFDVTVRFGNGVGEGVNDAVEDFARADFFDLSDDKKLTEPAFERLRSGTELKPPTPAVLDMPHQAVAVRYETKFLGDPAPLPTSALPDALLDLALIHGAVGRSGLHHGRTAYAGADPVPTLMKPRTYVAARVDNLRTELAVAPANTFTEAAAALAERPDLAALVQLVPDHEARP